MTSVLEGGVWRARRHGHDTAYGSNPEQWVLLVVYIQKRDWFTLTCDRERYTD